MKKKYAFYAVAAVVAVTVLFGLKWGSSNFSTGSLNLSWNASTESNIAGYKIYYGTTKRSGTCPGDNKGGYAEVIILDKDSMKIEDGKVKYEINGLKRNTEYHFSTTGYNSEGKESCFSEEVSKMVK